MNSCEFVTTISILACDIAKGKSNEEIAVLAAFLLNFGDTLITISAINNNDCSK